MGINFPIVTLPIDISKNTTPCPPNMLYTDLFLYYFLNFGNIKLVIIHGTYNTLYIAPVHLTAIVAYIWIDILSMLKIN